MPLQGGLKQYRLFSAPVKPVRSPGVQAEILLHRPVQCRYGIGPGHYVHFHAVGPRRIRGNRAYAGYLHALEESRDLLFPEHRYEVRDGGGRGEGDHVYAARLQEHLYGLYVLSRPYCPVARHHVNLPAEPPYLSRKDLAGLLGPGQEEPLALYPAPAEGLYDGLGDELFRGKVHP